MIEVSGDIFDLAFQCKEPNILLITTNGVWNSEGKAILGRGIAKTAKELFPQTPETLGTFLRMNYNRLKDRARADVEEPWNIPYRIGMKGQTHIFSFPTKPTKITVTKTSILPKYFSQRQMGMRIEGWKGFSLPSLIERSAKYISTLVGETPSLIERVFSIRPGCANGGLSWENQVKPLLEQYFTDDRFVIVERPYTGEHS